MRRRPSLLIQIQEKALDHIKAKRHTPWSIREFFTAECSIGQRQSFAIIYPHFSPSRYRTFYIQTHLMLFTLNHFVNRTYIYIEELYIRPNAINKSQFFLAKSHEALGTFFVYLRTLASEMILKINLSEQLTYITYEDLVI